MPKSIFWYQWIVIVIVIFLSKSAYAGPELPLRDLVNDLPLIGARCAAMGGAFAANDNPFSDRESFSMLTPALLPNNAGKASFTFHYTHYEGLETNGAIYQESLTILTKKFWGETVFAIEGMFAESDPLSFPPSTFKLDNFSNSYVSRHKSIFIAIGKKINSKLSIGIVGPVYNQSALTQEVKEIGGTQEMQQKFYAHTLERGASIHVVYSPWPNLQLALDFILMRQNETAYGDFLNGKVDLTRRDRYRIGLGYFPDDRTTIAFDVAYIYNHFPLDTDDRFGTERFFIGGERWITDYLALRLGCYDEAFTAGLGLNWRGLNLDYLFADDWGVNDHREAYGSSTETHLLTFTFKY